MDENSKFLVNYSKRVKFDFNKFFNNILNESSFKGLIDIFYRNIIRNVNFRRWLAWESKFRYRGLAVFIARNNSIELGLVDKISDSIKRYGFQIIEKKLLNDDEREKLKLETPLHKWAGVDTGRGYPEVMFVAYDPKPIDLHNPRFSKWLKFYPYLDNLRLIFKHSIRYSILEGIDDNQHSCLVHATDNSDEALEYIRILIPSKLESIKSSCHKI